ncbi:MAG: Kynureninase (L-kynurenine hydrolase) [Geoglossum simile]|nr:MAG: Kynureninase (L-kynurenine hydrolase) [Geoglossum simile]
MLTSEARHDKPIQFGDDLSKEYALKLDREDPLSHFREDFVIPTKVDLKSKTLVNTSQDQTSTFPPPEPCIYLCGNSLGLQPRITSHLIQQHLTTWATKGVHGHFRPLSDSPLPTWVQADEVVAKQMSRIVGALPAEVAVMGTLTGNLHLLMASFYRPDRGGRWKVIMEGKAFPSDHFAVDSQIRSHNLDPSDSLILIDPLSPTNPLLTTSQILKTITLHAPTTSLILLPGIQYYTGQLFDIPTITAHAHSYGIIVGWDLAHAAGNVELSLHDWDVDFAVWCNYKYLNAGPGAIGGLFVHERHGSVVEGEGGYRPRLGGWWGGDKKVRFKMENEFHPIPGAAGYQISNPSIIDLTSVLSSLTIFTRATPQALRKKSILLTSYLEHLLLTRMPSPHPFKIITPSSPSERGAQLSIRLSPGLLGRVMQELEEAGVAVDERQPDVVRVAPAPLYNSFEDVWEFVRVFARALEEAKRAKVGVRESKI